MQPSDKEAVREDSGQNRGEQRREHQREHRAKFHRGLEQFNSGHFFDAHETWEEIWLRSPEPEKTFLQGIIQIAAAFHHYGRGNLRGTRSLMEAGLRRLLQFPPVHNGIALESLRTVTKHWAGELAAGHDPGAANVPRIQFDLD